MSETPDQQQKLPHRVLLTGVAGRIGRVLRTKLSERYEFMRIADILPLEAGPGEDVSYIDVCDPATLDAALANIDCVVHLAGQGFEAEWEHVLQKNIIGVYNLFEAARRQGVKRVIYASSHHAIGFYRREDVIGNDVVPRPDSNYGVSKVFGEAMGRLYADKFGLEVASVRIGVFRDVPQDARHLSVWISEDDFAQLIRRCIEAPKFHYLTLYGVSANTRSFWRNPDAEKIGYVPKDNAEDYAAALAEMPTENAEITATFQGGYYCARNFAGDPDQIT